MDSGDELIGNRPMRASSKGLCEATSGLERREGIVKLPYGSTSWPRLSNYRVADQCANRDLSHDDPCAMRRSFSTTQITPKLRRHCFRNDKSKLLTGMETVLAHKRTQHKEQQLHFPGHYELSSDDSCEEIRLDDVSTDGPYPETHLSEHPRQESAVGVRKEEREAATDPKLTPPEVKVERRWRNNQEKTLESDSEESHLEESPLSGCSVDSEGQLEAEKYIAYLNQTVCHAKMESNNLMELHEFQAHEWTELKDRLWAEIMELRKQNTILICERMYNDGQLNKQITKLLLRNKQDTDRALATTLERQQKINELKLLVTMQQRYILALEDRIGELQTAFHVTCTLKEEDAYIQGNKLTALPMRLPAETQVRSGYQDVLGCDRSNYMPGTTTNPELAIAEVFDFAGETRLMAKKRDLKSFDMMKVPYVKGILASAV